MATPPKNKKAPAPAAAPIPLAPLIAGLTDEQREKLALEVRAELAKRYARLVKEGKSEYILHWGKVLFPEKFTLPFCMEMHGYFCSVREEPFTDTEAPRGHAKTAIKCFLIPIFQALEEPKKFLHYLNVQSTEEKALGVNTTIMVELETNPLVHLIYGNQVTKKRWTGQQFVLRNGVIFTAVGAGQSIRGINYRNIRPDYIIVDDLYDDEDIHNPDATLKKNAWFWGALYPARAKGRRSSIHVQGTAINTEDLLEKCKTMKSVLSRTFRAVKDWAKKEVLWKENSTFESLMDDRERMGSLVFFREMQNDRQDDSTSKIKRAWLENWEVDPGDMVFDRHKILLTVEIGNDPSIGKKVENDPCAFVVVYRWRYADSKKQMFFIDFVTQGHFSLDERVKKLQYIADQYNGAKRVRRARIEAISGFQDYTAEVKRRTTVPVKEVTWVKDKIAVLEDKSKYFEFGQVQLNKRLPQNIKDALVHQLTTNHPRNDDLRDALFLVLDEAVMWEAWV